jgi:murein L,D-transpeptidase YcbB/YkuD
MRFFIKILTLSAISAICGFCLAAPVTVLATALDDAQLRSITSLQQNDEDEDLALNENKLEPNVLPTTQWERLQQLKNHYKKLVQKTPKWPRLTYTKKLTPGESNSAILVVRQQLKLHNLLDDKRKMQSMVFDDKMAAALKVFQKQHFLEPDGIIGLKTRKVLNLSYQKRLLKIDKNIQRFEKLRPLFEGKYVWVNIPTFHLYAMHDNAIEQSQPVIVGSYTRQTPQIRTSINSIVLNPSWGVPVSIFVKDKIKRAISDPSYLDTRHYIVIDSSGQQVSSNSVDWQELSMTYFPYRIVQLPGSHNALGAIKFNMNNKESIYLHSTPHTGLFQKVSRAFSSGCIRLSDPFSLAAWVLQGNEKYTSKWFLKKIKARETRGIPLKKPIPVYMTYVTVWVDDMGHPQWSDPYDLDKL